MKYDIGITTFKYRFELFKNLIESIRKYNITSNIIVEVNGNTNSEFDESYREQLYDFLKKIPKTFVRIWPEFRALAKLWNDCIIMSTTDYILLLNDDCVITDEKFFDDAAAGINKYQGLFTIQHNKNGELPDFGFVMVNIHQMHNFGYFDERLLGIGKEDTDIMMRYRKIYKTEIPIYYSDHREHFGSNIIQPDYQKGNARHPLINMIIFDEKLKRDLKNYQQYPYEKFYRLNKYQIVNLTGINYEF